LGAAAELDQVTDVPDAPLPTRQHVLDLTDDPTESQLVRTEPQYE
jgi:hypothetical protein